ncbi:hypothetical protein EZV62_004558 [Acer yangbiense]|uniref:Uncharacterized protein n=1 Tax=Acer yangbiense TaxID=1000413 RepID=A0A5C7IK19_9ROSI|nr:hypothetical protein EZV62_004558 [Acer yangbiense]
MEGEIRNFIIVWISSFASLSYYFVMGKPQDHPTRIFKAPCNPTSDLARTTVQQALFVNFTARLLGPEVESDGLRHPKADCVQSSPVSFKTSDRDQVGPGSCNFLHFYDFWSDARAAFLLLWKRVAERQVAERAALVTFGTARSGFGDRHWVVAVHTRAVAVPV